MKTKLNALGIYQIIGGLLGIGLTIYLISSLSSIPAILFPLFSVAFGLFSYSIFSGILLFKNIKKGLHYSLINQILQVIQITAFGCSYEYISGLKLSVGLDLTESLNLNANLNFSSWQLRFGGSDSSFIVSLNLIALFLIIWISKIKVAIHKEEVNKQLNELGQEMVSSTER